MQQPGPMFPVMPSFPPTNITTEQIQKAQRKLRELTNSVAYLDENKKLILAILDNQNLGKLNECAQYQAQLQKNLMYLAAIADAQPQTPTMPTQMTPHPAMHQGGFYMQHPQAAAMTQQPGIFPPKAPFNNPHSLQDPQLQQQHQTQPHPQAPQAQMTLRPVGPNSSMNPTQNDTNLGGGSGGGIPTSNSSLIDVRGGNKKDKSDVNSDAPGNAGSGDGEQAK